MKLNETIKDFDGVVANCPWNHAEAKPLTVKLALSYALHQPEGRVHLSAEDKAVRYALLKKVVEGQASITCTEAEKTFLRDLVSHHFQSHVVVGKLLELIG